MSGKGIVIGIIWLFGIVISRKEAEGNKSLENCRDIRSDCVQFQNWNWCKTRRDTMKRICKQTCGLCDEKKRLNERMVATTYAPKFLRISTEKIATRVLKSMPPAKLSSRYVQRGQAIRIPIVENRCKDKVKDCSNFLRWGLCKTRKIAMKRVCSLTCSFCRKPTLQGERNKMVSTARPSTDVTITLKVTDTTTRSLKTTKQADKKNHCFDRRQDCPYLKQRYFCRRRRTSMRRVCPKTCNFCSTLVVKKLPKKKLAPQGTAPRFQYVDKYFNAKKSALCIDQYGASICQYYKRLGWCSRYNYVAKNCFKTCHCSQDITLLCKLAPYACCWDKKTLKQSADGLGCPDCNDDPRFVVLCDRFQVACYEPGGLGESVRRYCPKTCSLC